MSLGSYAELETQVIIAKELGYITEEEHGQFLKSIEDESKQIRSLILRLSNP